MNREDSAKLMIKNSLFRSTLIITFVTLFFVFPMTAFPANELSRDEEIVYLKKLSFENLLDIKVTSVSRKEEKLSDAAAAIYVITNEDIRRSGATNIPEALRMVPGLQVAHIDANKWAISSRGFNSWFSNKLLVIIDGRSVYTPLFSGVYWDVQDTPLEDIDRIEIIRGPGATLWGANAVNGVINIITKSAQNTQGSLVSFGAGSKEKLSGSARYGGKLGDYAYYRMYAKYFDRDEFVDDFGDNAADGWDAARAGFRIDWNALEHDSLTLQGDIYDGNAGQTLTLTGFLTPPSMRTIEDESEMSGGNIVAHWDHISSNTSQTSLQVYYDRTERNEAIIREIRDTFDLDFQHQFAIRNWHEVVWGLHYRYTSDDIDGSVNSTVDPDSRGDSLYTCFIQDNITLYPDRLHLILGSKFEHNDYTGFEFQPNIRFLLTPCDDHTIWAAVSRAVRTPSRADSDLRANLAASPGPCGSVNLLAVIGNSDFESEELIAYEIGYRFQPNNRFSLDVTTFYNAYNELRTVEPGIPFFETSPIPPHLVIPFIISNKMDGESYGLEIGVNFRANNHWRLFAGYSLFKLQLHRDALSNDPTAELTEGDSPQNQFQIRSYLDLPYNLEIDTSLYYVDNLANQGISGYTRLDARLGWHPIDLLEFSLILENLLDKSHPEFGMAKGVNPTEVQRSVYGKITWHF